MPVLVEGRRLGVGDPNTSNPNPAPDLEEIPAALLERIEVVTGGASARLVQPTEHSSSLVMRRSCVLR
jgi:hypothetical protein